MTNSSSKSQFSHFISPYSVSVYGESVGHSNISEAALLSLSYDVTYKLYEILKECKTEMNVYRQSTLSVTILNNVLENIGAPKFYGNKFLVPFVSIPNSDMSVIHLTKVNIQEQASNDSVNVELEQIPFIRGIYVSPLTNVCDMVNLMKSLDSPLNSVIPKLEPRSDNCLDFNFMDFNSHGSSNVKLESNVMESQSNSDFTDNFFRNLVKNDGDGIIERKESDYYLNIAQIIILNSSESLFKIVLNDLRTNPRLGNVYSSLLSLVSNSVKYFKCVWNLIDRLLRTVDALLNNQFVDTSSSYSVDDAVSALCTIILEPKVANDYDDFPVRLRASCLLMRALNTWNVSIAEKNKILATLQKALHSPEKMSLKLNYSILIMFYSLGCDILDLNFWPILNKYLNVLCSLDEIISGKRSILLTIDICRVKSALMLVSCILYRNFWSSDTRVQNLHKEADIILCSYFGECLFPIRAYGVPKTEHIFTNSTRKPKQNAVKDSLTEMDKNYRNIQLYAFRNPHSNSYSNILSRPKRPSNTVNDAFEVPPRFKRDRTITFNFIGSNQLDRNQLRQKHFDSRYNVQCTYRTFKKPFLTYERKTRFIKFCNSRKTCAGDIFLFL